MENINALNEISKGSSMGMDAISFIIEKVDDEKLEKLLKDQYVSYKKIQETIEEIYPKYDDGSPKTTNMKNKVMTDYMIEMKTIKDSSTSHLAEILIQGTNMGIIEGRRILNKKKLNEEVYNLIAKYVSMQEKYLSSLKDYL